MHVRDTTGAWRRIESSLNPGVRNTQALAWDSRRNRLVLSGGATRDERLLDDTWEFDGRSWVDMSAQATAQPPRAVWPAAHAGGHALAYDSRRGMSMLYGDRGPDATTLWGWDGISWHAFNQPGPGLRRHIKLAYDSARDRLVLYGGFDDSGRILNSDTWEWDGQSWSRVATDGPGPRASYAFAYDSLRRRVVLFGGLSANGPVNDTWGWDGIGGRNSPTTAPRRARRPGPSTIREFKVFSSPVDSRWIASPRRMASQLGRARLRSRYLGVGR